SPTEYRLGKNGRFLSCSAYNVPPVEVKPAGHKPPKSGGPWLLHKARGRSRPKITSQDNAEKIPWSKLSDADKKKFQKLSDEMPEPCRYAAPIDAQGKPQQPQQTDILCPDCGGAMTRRTGRFGPFLGCV